MNIKLYYLVVFFCIFFCELAFSEQNTDVQVDISINAKSYDDTSLPIFKFYKNDDKISVDNGHESNFVGKINNSEYEDVYKISIDGGSYVSRVIKLRRKPQDKNSIKRDFDVFFVKKDVGTLLEYAFDNLKCKNNNTQYGVKVRYNYARVLLEYCKSDFDTCDEAKSEWNKLKHDYSDGLSGLFIREKINETSFGNALTSIRDVEHSDLTEIILMSWPGVESKFNEGKTRV